MNAEKHEHIAHAVYNPITSSASNILKNDIVWERMFENMSHSYSKKNTESGESAQWSNGIDRMIQCADYIQQSFPRWITNCFFMDSSFSSSFSAHQSCFILSLLINLPNSGLEVDRVSSLLQLSKNLSSSNDDETKSNNTLRSHLFGAILRLHSVAISLQYGSVESLKQIGILLREYFLHNIDSISYDFCKDWADSIVFGYNCAPIDLSESSLASDIISNVRIVLKSILNLRHDASNTINSDEGFSRHAKYVLLGKALLSADLSYISSMNSNVFEIELKGSSKSSEYRSHATPANELSGKIFRLREGKNIFYDEKLESRVGDILKDILIDSSSGLVSSYRTIRVELCEILHLISLNNVASETVDLGRIIDKLQLEIDSNRSEYENSNIDGTNDSNTVDSSSIKSRYLNSIEVGVLWLINAAENMISRYVSVSDKLLRIAIIGSGVGDIDIAKRCHNSSISACALAFRSRYCAKERQDTNQVDIIELYFQSLVFLSKSDSWRVRSTVVLAASVILVNNWTDMSIDERKICRDIFNNAFYDAKPEIQLLGRTGMTAYFMTKSVSELTSLSKAYNKNNDIFADRYL